METLENKKSKTSFSSRKRKQNEFSQNVMVAENLQPGDILTVKINALGAKNIGVAELKNGYTVLVPNTKYGEKVQVKVEKIFLGKSSDSKLQQKIKYVVARLVEKTEESSNFEKTANSLKFDFQVGQKFKVTIGKKGPKNSGLVQLSKNFLVIVPNTNVGDKLTVEIQKIKQNYAFAKATNIEENTFKESSNEMIGKQFHIVIPSSAKTFPNYFVVKFNGKFVFVKKSLGVQLNDVVKIQIQKSTKNFAIAKILKISPLSLNERKFMVKQTVEKMIRSSMHFGEKAIRCNANMRKFIWYRKRSESFSSNSSKRAAFKESRKPMVKRGRHILNVLKTQRCFENALKQLAKYAAKGKTFLFVGTKKPAASLIAKTALLSKTAFFVNTRWLGGMLTNWKTILKSISQIRPILKQKQKILEKILEKRSKIERRLFQKVYLLRKKSQQFMLKGKYLIQQLLVSKNVFIEKNQKLIQKKNALLASNSILLSTAKNLKSKKAQTLKQIQELETAAAEISKQKKQLKVLMNAKIAKFNELEQFFEIGQKLLEKKYTLEKTGQKKLVTVSYEKFLTLSDKEANWNIPNPSAEIFQKMITLVSNLKKEDLTFDTSKASLASNRAKSSETQESVQNSNTTIVLSKFLYKFVLFLPFLKNAMQILSFQVSEYEKTLTDLNSTFNKIQDSQKLVEELYKKVNSQLSVVFAKFIVQRKNFQKFQTSFKQFTAEQRLLKFLPKLRYLPTSQAKMYQTVELFMKKFVDPKLSYPMEQIYDQKLKFTSKKIAATRKQKWQRLEKYFGGITKMAKMNTKQISKNVAIIIGQQEEMNAVHECRKLGMKIFAVVDTNCNPKFGDHIIPANDDSRNSIKYILGEMLTYIRLGQKLRQKVAVRAKFQQSRNRRFSTFAKTR